MPSKDATTRATTAETSAGRAGGYCWVEHPDGGYHCTLHPNHQGKHYDVYSRTEFD
ncbi:hypothetical protein K4749_01450 [Streptomyces sp. TRM72054]|uniref:hypothetical protein n=1 Tax=Streptomyces sp. TRM72054 TaxID=2870562 RepID=UPI001C8C823A|nr:hypothetical protein [Streptomyces sp. TRM72054]MBX9392294.1 hypothetical protein [Streptomyces sp. TRM72054]